MLGYLLGEQFIHQVKNLQEDYQYQQSNALLRYVNRRNSRVRAEVFSKYLDFVIVKQLMQYACTRFSTFIFGICSL